MTTNTDPAIAGDRARSANSRARNAAVRALLTAAAALAALILVFADSAQGAPPAFNWSSSVSTTQASGHPALTLNYSSSSAQSLTRLDVELPAGFKHKNQMTGACSNPLYLADSCPADSAIGAVSAQFTIGLLPVSVPGTIYQLSAPFGDADASFGIVLRPPLSSLGLTGKIFVRDQLTFTSSGALRHSFSGPLNSITVGNTVLPSRIAQLQLRFNAQAPLGTHHLLTNPSSCRTQQFRATGQFSDGTSVDRTSSYTTTGCPAVPFAPTAAVQLDNNVAEQRTSFAILLGAGPSTSSLQTADISSFTADLSSIGGFDPASIDSGPFCTDEQAASTTGCPADTKFADISAEIDGFGPVSGAVYKTNSPGHKTVGELTLRKGVAARFSGAIGVGSNEATLSFTGLPQLAFTKFVLHSSEASLWITNTCAIRTTRVSLGAHSGASVTRTPQVPAPDCTPPKPTIESGPERGITINTTHVEYRFSTTATGVTFECSKDDGAFAACASPFIDDWQGEGVHSFSVRGVRGGLTGPAATADFTVDTMPPVVTFSDPRDADADGDGVADAPFRTQDFEFGFDVTDETSGVDMDKLECSFVSDSDPAAPSTRGVKQPRPHTQGHVQCGGAALAPPGPGTMTVTAYDFAGHVTVLKLGVIVDGSPPEIELGKRRKEFSNASIAEVPFGARDDSLVYPQGEVRIDCVLSGAGGDIQGSAVRVITDRDSGRSKGFCAFADVPEGTYKVTVRGWDPVKKESVAEGELVVDRTAPAVEFDGPGDSDSDGDGVADAPYRTGSFDVSLSLADGLSGVDSGSATCVAKVKNKGVVKGNVVINSANRAVCSLTDLPEGDVDVEVSAQDLAGNTATATRGFVVDRSPPVVDIQSKGVYGEGQFSVPFDVTDPHTAGAECALQRDNAWTKGHVILMKREGMVSSYVCEIDGAEDGVDQTFTVTATDEAGNSGSDSVTLTVDTQLPVAELADPADLDADGDGFADQRYRKPAVDIPLNVSDAGSGIDPDSSSCRGRPRRGGVITGAININHGRLTCSFTGLPEDDVDVEIFVADGGGHVTVLKLAFTVDATGPVVSSVTIGSGGWMACADGEQVPVSYSASDPLSGLASATLTFGSRLAGHDVLLIPDQNTKLAVDCREMTTGLDVEYRFAVSDAVGNVSEVTGTVKPDSTPPAVSVTKPAADGAVLNDSTPIFALHIDDDNPASTTYEVVSASDPTVVEASGDLGTQTGDFDFEIAGSLSAGLHKLNIVHRDLAARNVLVSRTFSVQLVAPPQVSITSPVEGQSVTRGTMMPVVFNVVGEGPISARCLIDEIVVLAACSSGSSINTAGLTTGPHLLKVAVTDALGQPGNAIRVFQVVGSGGGDVCIAIYPIPPGCPGYIPPGGGGIITVP